MLKRKACIKVLSLNQGHHIANLSIFPVMGKYLLVSEHPLLLLMQKFGFMPKKQVGYLLLSSRWIVFINGSRTHCCLEGSLLINHIYLWYDSKVFTKEFFWISPMSSSVWAGASQPTEKCEELGKLFLFPCEQAHIAKAIPNKGDGVVFHTSSFVPKILLEMFILLPRKAFLGDRLSSNLKSGWMCVLLVSIALFGSTWHSECRPAPKPKHLSFWNIFVNSNHS